MTKINLTKLKTKLSKAKKILSEGKFNSESPELLLLIETLEETDGKFENAQESILKFLGTLFYSHHFSKPPKKLTQSIIKFLSHPNKELRRRAFFTIVEIYKISSLIYVDHPEYDEIMSDDKNRITNGAKKISQLLNSIKRYDFTETNLKKAIKAVSQPPRKIDIKDCSVCRELPENATIYKDKETWESLPENHKELEYILKVESRDGGIKRCPICHRLYAYQYHYEWFTTGAEEEETLELISPKEVNKLFRVTLGYYVKPSKILNLGDIWQIEFQM